MKKKISSNIIKAFIAFVLTAQLIVVLSGCGGLYLAPLTEIIEYNNQKYKTGFYGDLFFPVNAAYDDFVDFESHDFELLNGRFFHQLISDEHRWIYTFTGAVMKVYCHIDDFEKEKAFYNDSSNFDYMCAIGNVYTSDIRAVMDDFEPSKYSSLMQYIKQNKLNKKHKAYVVEPISYSYEKREKCEIRFYKKSKDGYFSSTRSHTFVAISDKLLYFLEYLDNDDENIFVCGVELPDSIGSYFLDYIKNYQL